MAKPNIKLAESLEELKFLQKEIGEAIKTNELMRTHRERLVKHHFLQEVTKGWYIITNPNIKEGDTTAWYRTFWKFCKRYLEDKYQQKYASVRIVLGHFMFVYIHPYMDENGRMGRFLMNLMLASGGYPWTVISLNHHK